MIIVKYRNGELKEYKTLEGMILEESIQISPKRLSIAIREQDYYGYAVDKLLETNIIHIKWTNRFEEVYEYDIRYGINPIYWDIYDFTEMKGVRYV